MMSLFLICVFVFVVCICIIVIVLISIGFCIYNDEYTWRGIAVVNVNKRYINPLIAILSHRSTFLFAVGVSIAVAVV
jgi:hypothetical protein